MRIRKVFIVYTHSDWETRFVSSWTTKVEAEKDMERYIDEKKEAGIYFSGTAFNYNGAGDIAHVRIMEGR